MNRVAAALSAALEPSTAAESLLRSAQALEKEKRDALQRTLRKSAAVLRAELMDEEEMNNQVSLKDESEGVR